MFPLTELRLNIQNIMYVCIIWKKNKNSHRMTTLKILTRKKKLIKKINCFTIFCFCYIFSKNAWYPVLISNILLSFVGINLTLINIKNNNLIRTNTSCFSFASRATKADEIEKKKQKKSNTKQLNVESSSKYNHH